MGLGASDSSKLRGLLDALDGLDAVDVATGVATDPAYGRDTIGA
jgi:hypothetical protein